MKILPENHIEIWGGLECTINRVKESYHDQLGYTQHRNSSFEIDIVAELGIKKMRYPLLWEHHQPAKETEVNWEDTAAKLSKLRAYGIDVIAGLVHHGSGPDFVHMCAYNFANGLADYAARVARNFPWINNYTPVNEPLTTARFCGLYGLWYPHQQNDSDFCRILVNECKATVLAMAAIRKVNPDAKLVQTEDLGKVHSSPSLTYQADFENERRWLSFDLLCGHVTPTHALWSYLTSNGITEAELSCFLTHPCPPDIIGVNYYLTSERYIDEDIVKYPHHTHGGNGHQNYADVEAVRVGEVCPDGIGLLLKDAWNRYKIPIAVTEVHLHCTREEQMRWLKQVWDIAGNLKKNDIPILAITPWALFGSYGWDKLLTSPKGTYECGAYDANNGQLRPTALTAMIKAYCRGENFKHPLLSSPGWWQRSCRVEYGKDEFFSPVMPSGKPLLIKGRHSSCMARLCRQRCINYIEVLEFDQVSINDIDIWATITVEDSLCINQPGYKDLIIALPRHEPDCVLNMALDLFIDGERGEWHITTDGSSCEPVLDVSVMQHVLAS